MTPASVPVPDNSRLSVDIVHTSSSAAWKPCLAVSGHVHEHRRGVCGGRAGLGQHRGGGWGAGCAPSTAPEPFLKVPCNIWQNQVAVCLGFPKTSLTFFY